MKAIVVSEHGGPDRLELEEVPEPTPGSGELLVEVAAAGLNFIDVYHREGLYPLALPMTPGLEGAGVVRRAGEGSEFAAGDRVTWTSVLGSYADMLVVPEDSAIRIPDGVETDTAAAVLLQGITAHYLAVDTFPLSPGDRCLIHAGAGGVGLLLTQIAKLRGAEVFTTVGSESKAELSREAGADHVINYTEQGFKDAIEDIAGPKALDVVYDGVGKSTFFDGLDLLRPRGLMATFGNASGPVEPVSPLELSSRGSLYLTRPTIRDYIATRQDLEQRANDLFRWIEEGDLRVRIGTIHPLADAAKAHEELESRETTGKTLLRPGS